MIKASVQTLQHERKVNMKHELDTIQIKKIATKILVEFDRICRSNEICYSIAYGTMLGAVRHHGFIPWDDDVDVIVTREAYNKILKVAYQMKPDYELISLDTNSSFMAPLAKIVDKNTELYQLSHKGEKVTLGVYIDVFVYDKVPRDKTKRQLLYKIVSFLEKCWSFCENSSNKSGVFGCVRSLFNKTLAGRFFSLIINRIASKKRNSGIYSNLMY